MHIQVTIDAKTRMSEDRKRLCPSAHNRLHHLVYVEAESQKPDKAVGRRGWEDKRVFYCSASDCPATVTVCTRPPYIDEGFRALLTDKAKLRERKKRAVDTMNEENAGKLPSFAVDQLPAKVVGTLITYLKNTVAKDRRDIPRKNARYVSMISDDCREIFETAGFTESQVRVCFLAWG